MVVLVSVRYPVVVGIIAFGLLNPDPIYAPTFQTMSEDRPSVLERVGEIGLSVAVGAVLTGVASRVGPVRNAHLGGKTHPKTGVPFNAEGYPDFSGFRHPDVPDVRIELSGSRSIDFLRANAAAGLKETPSGYTWHHHQEQGLLQLVDRRVHAATGHTGGFSGQ